MNLQGNLRVAIFTAPGANGAQEKVNDWLRNNHVSIGSIQISSTEAVTEVLITYQKKSS